MLITYLSTRSYGYVCREILYNNNNVFCKYLENYAKKKFKIFFKILFSTTYIKIDYIDKMKLFRKYYYNQNLLNNKINLYILMKINTKTYLLKS